MKENIKYEDTLSCKTYMKVGGVVNSIMRFGGTLQQSHMSYANPGFYYGMGNCLFASFLCFTVIGFPVVIKMTQTFKKYNATTPYRIYLFFAILASWLYLGLIFEQIFHSSNSTLYSTLVLISLYIINKIGLLKKVINLVKKK